MIKYCDNELGCFEYDDEIYEEINKWGAHYLHFKDSYVGPISLPKGLLSCSNMFQYCTIKNGCYFKNFDTRQVTDMSSMFEGCKMPKNFTFDNVNFNTHYVKSMYGMFMRCVFSQNFSLGKKFYTINCEDMGYMFSSCIMNKDFTLGEYFDTSNVKIMNNMFSYCTFPENFTLGDKFSTNKVIITAEMFDNTKLNEIFTLGKNFDTSNCMNMVNMFLDCKIPKDFIFPKNFTMEKVDLSLFKIKKHINHLGLSKGINKDRFKYINNKIVLCTKC